MKSKKMLWPEVAVEDFTEVVTGGTPSTKKPEYWKDGKIPWLNSGELNKRIIRQANNFITEEGLNNSAAKMMPEDTVLVALTGATTGVSALLKTIACANQSVTGILPSKKHHPHFLFHYFQSIRRKIIAGSYGGAQKHISQAYVKKIKVPLPPFEEQTRIANLLDEADKLRNLRAQADRRTADLTAALFHEIFGDPFSSPKGWPIVRVDEAGKVQLGRQRAPKYQTGKYTHPYVRVANVFEDQIDVSDLLSMDFNERDFEQYRLEHGDILLNEGQSTELVGRPAIWRNEVADCCFQNTLIRFQADKAKILPDFALAVFLTYFREGKFANISSKTSNVAHLGASRFAKMPFPLPPIEMQKEFAQRVTEIRELETSQVTSRTRLDTLFQSMLHRAFNGNL